MTIDTRPFKTESEALEAYGMLRRQAFWESTALPEAEWLVAGKLLCPCCLRTLLISEKPIGPGGKCRACKAGSCVFCKPK